MTGANPSSAATSINRRLAAVALAASCAVLAPTQARAEAPPDGATDAHRGVLVPASTPAPYGPVVSPYQRVNMRTAGIVLTGIAIGEVVLGSVLLGVGADSRGCGPGGACSSTTDTAVGSTLIGTSVVLAAIGIPLWIIGSRPFRVESSAKAAPPIQIVPSATGLRLAF